MPSFACQIVQIIPGESHFQWIIISREVYWEVAEFGNSNGDTKHQDYSDNSTGRLESLELLSFFIIVHSILSPFHKQGIYVPRILCVDVYAAIIRLMPSFVWQPTQIIPGESQIHWRTVPGEVWVH